MTKFSGVRFDIAQSKCTNSFLFAVFILPIFLVRGRGVCSMVNRETLSEHRSELRSDALPATTVFWDLTHCVQIMHSNH